MKKFLIVIFSALLITLPARAEMTSDSYRMAPHVISSGGEEEMTSDSYRMQDIKGQAVIGEAASPSYKGEFGGVYGPRPVAATPEVVFAPPPLLDVEWIDLADTGRIRSTNIRREGEDIILTWDYDDRGATDVRIYYSSGPDAVYAEEMGVFPDFVGVAGGTTTRAFAGSAHDGSNYYYRVVPEPLLPDTTIFSPANNSISVGKVEIAVPANKFDFVGLPFMEDGYNLGGILGDQLGDGGEYYYWDENTQTNPGAAYVAASSEWLGSARPMRLGDGFYVRARSAKQLALVGRFGELLAPLNKGLTLKPRYNLIAFPYPTSKTIGAMGLALEEGADVYEWMNYAAYNGAAYTAAGWIPAGVDDLQLSRPRFYRPVSSANWSIDP